MLIEFKSCDEYFYKERSGRKNNTIRVKDKFKDERFLMLDYFIIDPVRERLLIRIVNVETGESFLRTVKDVSTFENFYIITWEV